ncbi:voltage dependent ion channel [Chrysochromulina tobinii]|uniref:Voltage dependent ion channel n=1 Tax=Chrysochromulina tobinii TaxID=1460289 RepID=A0A0M0JH16_9EUKA|nr:voltage dependent ion channel [Chrysochromulina tobinii]|eukprot:KOO25765.1 voltage dependent ion channel [Chrysochromulina sp. CCMP291]
MWRTSHGLGALPSSRAAEYQLSALQRWERIKTAVKAKEVETRIVRKQLTHDQRVREREAALAELEPIAGKPGFYHPKTYHQRHLEEAGQNDGKKGLNHHNYNFSLRQAAHGERGQALDSTIKLDAVDDATAAEQLKELLRVNRVRVIDLFTSWDLDGNGVVTRNEFERAFSFLGYEASASVVDKLFTSLDANESGSIDFAELNQQLRATFRPRMLPMHSPRGALASAEPSARHDASALATALPPALTPHPPPGSPWTGETSTATSATPRSSRMSNSARSSASQEQHDLRRLQAERRLWATRRQSNLSRLMRLQELSSQGGAGGAAVDRRVRGAVAEGLADEAAAPAPIQVNISFKIDLASINDAALAFAPSAAPVARATVSREASAVAEADEEAVEEGGEVQPDETADAVPDEDAGAHHNAGAVTGAEAAPIVEMGSGAEAVPIGAPPGSPPSAPPSAAQTPAPSSPAMSPTEPYAPVEYKNPPEPSAPVEEGIAASASAHRKEEQLLTERLEREKQEQELLEQAKLEAKRRVDARLAADDRAAAHRAKEDADEAAILQEADEEEAVVKAILAEAAAAAAAEAERISAQQEAATRLQAIERGNADRAKVAEMKAAAEAEARVAAQAQRADKAVERADDEARVTAAVAATEALAVERTSQEAAQADAARAAAQKAAKSAEAAAELEVARLAARQQAADLMEKAAATGEKINWTAMDPAVMIEGTKMAAAEKEGARTLEKLRKTKAEADQINSLLKAASTKRLKKEKQAAVERAAEVEAINARVAGKASSSDAAEVPRGPGVG